MGEAGSPYPRFQRALKSRDLHLIRTAALECRRIDLDDALIMIDVYRDKAPGSLERACLRWLARYCTEKAATVEDVGVAVDAMEQLRAQPQEAMETLMRLCR